MTMSPTDSTWEARIDRAKNARMNLSLTSPGTVNVIPKFPLGMNERQCVHIHYAEDDLEGGTTQKAYTSLEGTIVGLSEFVLYTRLPIHVH